MPPELGSIFGPRNPFGGGYCLGCQLGSQNWSSIMQTRSVGLVRVPVRYGEQQQMFGPTIRVGRREENESTSQLRCNPGRRTLQRRALSRQTGSAGTDRVRASSDAR